MNLENALLKAKTDMREELRSSPQPAWSRSYLRSRSGFQSAPCSSSHLDFLKHSGKFIATPKTPTLRILLIWTKQPGTARSHRLQVHRLVKKRKLVH